MNNVQDIKKVLRENPRKSIAEITEILCRQKHVVFDSYYILMVEQIIGSHEELKALLWISAGYGVNIGHLQEDGNVEYERYATFDTLKEAENAFNVLTGDIETDLWDEVQIEKIWERGDEGDYDYEVIKEGRPNNDSHLMTNKAYWKRIVTVNSKKIHDFEVEADHDCGRVLNICWLNLGYISPDSDCGFFYYSSKKEFDKLFSEVKHISEPAITKSQIKEYLSWLECNECLFKKDKSQIEQISDMLAWKH